jgi:hypothetical protein
LYSEYLPLLNPILSLPSQFDMAKNIYEESVAAEDQSHGSISTKDTKRSAMWGTIACGSGLFSDGYLNAVSILSEMEMPL